MTTSRENLIGAFIEAKAAWLEEADAWSADGYELEYVGVQKNSDDEWKAHFGVRYPDYMTCIADRDADRANALINMTPEQFADEVESVWEDEWTDQV